MTDTRKERKQGSQTKKTNNKQLKLMLICGKNSYNFKSAILLKLKKGVPQKFL